MKTYFNILFAGLFSLLSVATSKGQTGIAVPELQSVDHIAAAFMQKWNCPGGQIAITRNGKLIYNRGFGYADSALHTLVQPYSLFRIASVTKPFTSAAIMLLYEQGKIGLDDVVFGTKGILNEAEYSQILDPDVKKITIRMLLQHSGGWNRDISGDPMFNPVNIAHAMSEKSPADAVTIIRYVLANQKLDFAPGTSYAYSNLGYCILGRVIEKISGMGYKDFITKNILLPDGITDMVPGRSLMADAAPDEVHYYDYPGAPLATSCFDSSQQVPWPYGGFNIEAMDSHGEWISTAEDLVKFALSVDGYNTYPDILKPATIDTMVTPSANNSNYAMGWEVNKYNNWWHNGSLPGTYSEVVRTSNGMTWALLFNSRAADQNSMFTDMDNLVWNAIANVTQWPAGDQFLGIAGGRPDVGEILVYPNPFSGSSSVQYHLNKICKVSIVLTDMTGKEKAISIDEAQDPGDYRFELDPVKYHITPGVYMLRLSTGNGCITKKIVKL